MRHPAEGLHKLRAKSYSIQGQGHNNVKVIIRRMRINLITPFAEKDAVKALGARWDATNRLWYVVDVADLTPFLRWIPNVETAAGGSDAVAQTSKPMRSSTQQAMAPEINASVNTVPHCGCDVLPWDDCIHTKRT